MQIIVAGLGKVGSYLAGELSMEGHDVTVVDIKADHVSNVTSQYDVMGINGNIIDPETFSELDLANTDLFIAVAAKDEINLLACLLAKKEGASRTIARVRSPEYRNSMDYLQEQLGLEMIINPEQLAAMEMERVLAYPGVIDVDTFSQKSSEIVKFRLPEKSILAGLPVKDIHKKVLNGVLVCVVEREGKAHIPDGNFVLEPRDLVSVAGARENVIEFLKRSGLKSKPISSVMMVGAGKIAYYLLERTKDTDLSMTVIDRDLEACEWVARQYPKAIVINGEASDPHLLMEEGLEDMDAFISLTGIDEENVFLSLYAARRMNIKTITKINRIYFDEIFYDLELDTIINPKRLTAEYIIRRARSLANSLGSNVETVHKLANDQVEAVEFQVRKGSEVIGIPLMNLPIKSGVLIALIVRKGKMILPRGNDELLEGDNVVIITNRMGFVDVADILKKGGKNS